jgi:hypothetical protein
MTQLGPGNREAELRQKEAELNQKEAELKQKETDFKKEEWKECRATVDRCDKLLVELRKTGFGLMTAIVTAATFLMVRPGTPPTSGTQVADFPEHAKWAIFLTIILLALALYYLDRVHQNFLRAAVERAKELEGEIGYEITKRISEAAPTFRVARYGTGLYGTVIGTSVFAFVVVQNKGLQDFLCDGYLWSLVGGSVVGMLVVSIMAGTGDGE